MEIKQMQGQRFGLLLVLQTAGRTRGGAAAWLCLCDCGTGRVISGTQLRKKGGTRSCGCLRSRAGGLSRSPTYNSWAAMKLRCGKPNVNCYKNHGGRGITVCERWLLFENFLADMGERPAGTSLERVNNDGNYEPGNCVWATRVSQANNTRSNVKITALGRTLTIAQWARTQRIAETTIHDRMRDGVAGDDLVMRGRVFRHSRWTTSIGRGVKSK